jgi:integrase
VEEIIAVMRAAGHGADGARRRALIVILWRAGLRIGEALDLAEADLDASRGAVLVRRGKGGGRREVGMDRWAWSQLEPWIAVRRQLPVGALLCVIRGASAGRRWESSSARKQLGRTAVKAGVRRRFAPHQLRRAHAVEMAHEGVPLVVIQRQLGHYAGDLVKGSFGSGVEDAATGLRTCRGSRGAGHDACSASRVSRPSKIFSRPTCPLLAASSRWRSSVGRNSCVVWK